MAPLFFFYGFKESKAYAVSLSVPRELVCQVPSNVAGISYDMLDKFVDIIK